MAQTPQTDKTLGERLSDSLTGRDEEIGERNQATPFWMVFWTYPICLAIFALFLAWLFWMWGGYPLLPVR